MFALKFLTCPEYRIQNKAWETENLYGLWIGLCEPCRAIRQIPLALRTGLSSPVVLGCDWKVLLLWRSSVLQLLVQWRISESYVFLFPGGMGGEATQQLAQENIATVQHITYKCLSKRCQVHCWIAGIRIPHISAWILALQTQTGFPKLLLAVYLPQA